MRLSCEGLSHSFAGRPPLFNGLTLDFTPGALTALTGPSGSGKSTLLALLAGFDRPLSGRVVRDSIRHVGWVFQNPVGIPRRTAVDHVTFPLLTRGWDRPAAERHAAELLDRFGLTGRAQAPFRRLSGGEAQRLMLARAVAADYDVLLIDEPTAQLDPQNAQTVIDVIQSITDQDTITLIATHDQRLVDRCERIITLGGPA